MIESYRGRRSTWPTTPTSTSSGLRAIIDAKVAGEEIVAPQEEAPPKVIDLMEALPQAASTR